MTHCRAEIARKAVHVGTGGFALFLRWLPWTAAALLALFAILFNVFALHRLTGRALLRDGEKSRGFSSGITLYPVAVFLLILVGIFFVLTFLDLDRFGPFGYLILALLVVISGLLALFYPVVALPGGLAADLAPLPIGGSYWGSATTGSDAYAWGAGLGWWLLAFGVLLAGIGASLPYLKSVREMRRVKPWDRPRAA